MVPNVDPAFYRMIGDLTGEVRGLKENLEFRTRLNETQVGEIKADIRITKHTVNNQQMKMAALETLLDHGISDICDRVGDVERRIEKLDAKVSRDEKPVEELMKLYVRLIAWISGIAASGGVIFMFLGRRLIGALEWLINILPGNLP